MEFIVNDVAQDAVRIGLNGRLDTPGVDQIEVRFNAAAVAGGRHALVDLSLVTFVSSMGIRLLLTAARAMHAHGRRLVLFGAPAMVQETLDSVAIESLVPLVDTQDAALAAARTA